MKILIYDTAYVRTQIIREVTGVQSLIDSVIWDGGQISGISGHYIVLEDGESEECDPKKVLYFTHKLMLLEEKLKTSQRIFSGFTSTSGHQYEYQELDQTNLAALVMALTIDSSIKSVEWKTEDSGEITHSREEFFQLFKEAEEFKRSCVEDYRMTKEQLLKEDPIFTPTPSIPKSPTLPELTPLFDEETHDIGEFTPTL